MSEETSTTDAPAQDTGATEPAQPDQADQSSADNTNDTTTQSDTGEGESQSTKVEEPNVDEITEWASKKGLEIDANNPNEVKLAQMQRDAEKKMHQSTKQASELRNAVNQEVQQEMSQLPADDQTLQMQAQLEQLQINQAINDFYAQNPEAAQYDQAMAQLVKENPQLAAGGLEALYAVAKTRELENGGKEQIKAQGGQEALKELASKQKAAAPSANATSYQSSGGITAAEVGERTRAGDVAWLREHAAEIDAL